MASRLKVLFIFGTRPEAIKLAPVIRCFREQAGIEARVCVTAQHREILDQVLATFDIVPDYDLNVMTPGQSLSAVTARIMAQVEPVLRNDRPDMILVQGDTTTTLCGALAGFYGHIPVGHVEAGLRTGDIRQPFPEEMNRVVVSRLAAVHFAPTEGSARNLRAEGLDHTTVHVTGNVGIDAVLFVRDRLLDGTLASRQWDFLDPDKKLILVTAHRRESFGAGFESICAALRRIADRADVQVVYPMHPNPNISGPGRRLLEDHPNVHLIEPLDYVSFVDLMRHAYLLLTDSGGIQEEAPSLGKPVLVLREKTERPEAVDAGTSTLVGVGTDRIAGAAEALIEDPVEYERRSRVHNPYGDGHASDRIANVVLELQRHRPGMSL